jgi:hypothetical protein
MNEYDLGMGGKVIRVATTRQPHQRDYAKFAAKTLISRGLTPADYFVPDERFNTRLSPSPEAVAKAYAELV